MELESTFTVDADPDAVYLALVDLERVGPCIPGASVGPAGDDGAHPADIIVKVGPMRMTYRGAVRLVEQDAGDRRAVLAADVREARGQGSARARMTMQVAAGQAGGATVSSTTDVDLTGRVAQMGRGIIDDVAQRIVSDMAQRLSAMLAAQETPAAAGDPASADAPASNAEIAPGAASAGAAPPAPPVNGLRLLLRVLWARVARLFGAGPRS